MFFAEDIEALVGAGANQMDRGEVEQAISVWKEAVRLDPNHLGAHAFLATAYLHEYDVDSAIQCWQEVIRIDMANELESRQILTKLAANQRLIDPVVAQAYYKTAWTHVKLGAFESATVACQRSLEINATNAEAQHLLGYIYGLQERYSEAILAFKAAIRIKPDYLLAYENLFTALMAEGRRGEADAVWHQAIEINPTYEVGSRLLMRAKHLEGYFEEVVAKHRLPAEAHFGFKDSRTTFYTQEEFDVVMHHAHHFQAQIELNRENIAGAIRELQEVLKTDPDDLDAHKGLALIYSAQNRQNEATVEWQEVLRLSPDDKDARKYLKKSGKHRRFWPFR